MLNEAFFNREADVVARDLLGMVLVREREGKEKRYIITETEAYMGPHDHACHASKGRTKRTEMMFKGPGTIYMYLIYGMYWMLNIVVREEGYPAAVLIRGVGEWDGPGKLTRDLDLDKTLNGKALGKETGIWIEKGDSPQDIVITPRIGIDYAGEWKDKPLRFLFKS